MLTINKPKGTPPDPEAQNFHETQAAGVQNMTTTEQAAEVTPQMVEQNLNAQQPGNFVPLTVPGGTPGMFPPAGMAQNPMADAQQLNAGTATALVVPQVKLEEPESDATFSGSWKKDAEVMSARLDTIQSLILESANKVIPSQVQQVQDSGYIRDEHNQDMAELLNSAIGPVLDQLHRLEKSVAFLSGMLQDAIQAEQTPEPTNFVPTPPVQSQAPMQNPIAAVPIDRQAYEEIKATLASPGMTTVHIAQVVPGWVTALSQKYRSGGITWDSVRLAIAQLGCLQTAPDGNEYVVPLRQ